MAAAGYLVERGVPEMFSLGHGVAAGAEGGDGIGTLGDGAAKCLKDELP